MVRSDDVTPTCSSCHARLPADATWFCPWCGVALTAATLARRLSETAPTARLDRAPTARLDTASDTVSVASSSHVPQTGPADGRQAMPAMTSVVVIALSATLIVLFGFLRLWWAELVLVPATILLVYSSVEVPWEQYVDRAEGLVGPRALQLRAVARSSSARLLRGGRRLGLWASVRGHHAQVWLQVRTAQVPVRRRHEQVLHALGRAVYSGDQATAASHRMAAATTGARLEHLETRLAVVRQESHVRLHRGRGTDVGPPPLAAMGARAATKDGKPG